MREFEKRVSRLEQRNNPGLMTLLIVSREKAIARSQNPPSLEQLEAELAEKIAETEALEKSMNPLSQSIAKARRRVIVPDLEKEIAALKSGRRVLIVDTGIDRDPVDS